MSLLGIDIGTTSCKAVAYTVGGSFLFSATRTYPVNRSDGHAELSVHLVEAAVAEAVREVACGCTNDKITALCVTSMGEAFVLVDADGAVGDVSILGQDSRGKEEMVPVIASLGEQAFHRITGNMPNENYGLAKLLWLRKNDPELFRKARRFLSWSEYIAFRLGAIPASGYSHANRSLLFDVAERTWSQQVMHAAALDPELLPLLLPEGSGIGIVSRKGEADFGVPSGAMIILGGHDQTLNALGAGCVSSGTAVCGMGTFECITPVYAVPPATGLLYRLGLNIEHHAITGLFVSFIYNQSGSVAEWFIRNFVREAKTVKDGFALIEREMPNAPARPLFLPLLENSGAPYFINEASAVYEGMKFDCSRGELFKATLEGITFYFLESLKGLGDFGVRLDELTVTGGASASDAWLRLKADIFGLPVVRLADKDAGAMGAAMLAGLKTDVYRDVDEAVALFVHETDRFEPDLQKTRFYAEKHALYLDMYSGRSEHLARLSRLSGY